MTAGLVSVIVPVYNRPMQLEEAVASAVAQDYRPIEILIIDDGSTDGLTPATAQKLVKRHPDLVSVIQLPNGGPGLAREAGRTRARGEFIQYLDSDDVLLPGKFKAQVAALQADPEADAAYGITLFRDHAGVVSGEPHKDTGIARRRMFPEFLNSRWWETATPLYRASALARIGPWTDLRLEEDWEYDCRLAASGGVLVYCPQPVSEHRDHGGDRLSRGASLDPTRLRMRAKAHELVWAHAQRARLPEQHAAAVRRYARSLFLLARQCGAAGLVEHCSHLLAFAERAAESASGPAVDMRIYRSMTRLLGARRAGMLSLRIDALRAVWNGQSNV